MTAEENRPGTTERVRRRADGACRDRDLTWNRAVMGKMRRVLHMVLDPLAPQDELVLDGIGVADHEPHRGSIREGEVGRMEGGPSDRHVDRADVGLSVRSSS